MVGIGDELQTKAGPLPVWAWAGLGTLGIAAFLVMKKKQSMAAASTGTDNTSTVIGGPSTLIPTASPMPFSTGDTFVDTTINNLPPGGATGTPCPQGVKPINGKCPPILPVHPTLPAVDPSKSPAKIAQNSAEGKTMIKVGCFNAAGHYTGKQVSGGAPVYGLVNGWFMQGASVHAHGAHCIYVPAKFKAYIGG